jgi:hypothetical protein
MTEAAMNERVRLQKAQTALSENGVEDVKFFFSDVTNAPASKVMSDAADVLEACLMGKARKIAAIGDSDQR